MDKGREGSMKRIILVSLLLAGCAYTPNIDTTQQARPTYASDLQACQDKQYKLASRMFGPLGTISYLYNRNEMTDAEVKESDNAITPEGKKAIIDNCMKNKGYKIQP
jgi:hypothetical protein